MICFVFSPLVNFLRKIAYPFSFLYGWITGTRNYLYDNKVLNSTEFSVPTIVVGNLSVGGTGKTPQIEYLIRLLQKDYKIAVLSRGYKRKSKGFIIADENVTAETIGDEPFLYYKKFKDIIVSVDANRTHGIQQLIQLNNQPEVVLLDDAFQHRKVVAGFNILLTSYKNLYVDDNLLPTGNLRENISGAERAQIIIVSKCPSQLSDNEQYKIANRLNPTLYQTVFFTNISYDETLKGAGNLSLSDLKKKEVLLVTGIANSTPLTEFLSEQEIRFKHLKFPDHHYFTSRDIGKIKSDYNALSSNKKLILTTEKDYVRIFDKLKNLYYISIKTTFISHKNDFDTLIKNYVEQSSGNH